MRFDFWPLAKDNLYTGLYHEIVERCRRMGIPLVDLEGLSEEAARILCRKHTRRLELPVCLA